jgi:hypothetical protein
MRLVDKVANSTLEIIAPDAAGTDRRLTGVGSKSDVIRSCELRYILDDVTSHECMNLLAHPNEDLLDPANDLLRLPAESFWVEWRGNGNDERTLRAGALIEACEGGRSGLITGYWEDGQGRADTMGVATEFDLDRPLRKANPPPTALNIQHGLHQHLNRLFEHAVFRIDEAWLTFFRTRSPEAYQAALRDVANGNWYFLPFVMAFAAMLNSRDILSERRSQLDRLNLARLRRGRPALLDHIEITMNLAGSHGHGGDLGVRHGRHAPRLHHVRGHFVTRAGKKFWRSSHLRGDASGVPVRKTVLVTSQGSRRRRAEG